MLHANLFNHCLYIYIKANLFNKLDVHNPNGNNLHQDTHFEVFPISVSLKSGSIKFKIDMNESENE